MIDEPFYESLKGLIAIHELDRHGKNDSDEADDIRDKMDAPWYKLTQDQQDIFREVSALLNEELDRKRLSEVVE